MHFKFKSRDAVSSYAVENRSSGQMFYHIKHIGMASLRCGFACALLVYSCRKTFSHKLHIELVWRLHVDPEKKEYCLLLLHNEKKNTEIYILMFCTTYHMLLQSGLISKAISALLALWNRFYEIKSKKTVLF